MAGLVVLAFAVVIVFLLVRILNLTDSARTPKIFASKHPFVDQVLQSCPILFERYVYKLLFFQTLLRAAVNNRTPRSYFESLLRMKQIFSQLIIAVILFLFFNARLMSF